MKKLVKILLIIGIILTLVGGIIFAVAMTASGWDFGSLATQTVSQKSFEISDDKVSAVLAVKINSSTADIKITYHDEQEIVVDGYEIYSTKGELLAKTSVEVVDGELIIEEQRIKYNWFSFSAQNPSLLVKLPRGKQVGLSVDLSTGDIAVGESGNDYTFGAVFLKTTTGDIYLNGNLSCLGFGSEGSTGDLFINGNLKTGEFERDCSTGDLVINSTVVAMSAEVEQTTGQVKGDGFITAKTILIDTTTGDVKINLLGSKKDYSYTYEIITGDSNILPFENGEKVVKIKCTTGNIWVGFEKE